MESWGLSSWVCHSVTLGRFRVTIIIRSANTHSAQIQMNLHSFCFTCFKTLTKVLSRDARPAPTPIPKLFSSAPPRLEAEKAAPCIPGTRLLSKQ